MTTSPSQLAAEFLWVLATSENNSYADSRTEVYRAAEASFKATLKAEYRLADDMVDQVRDVFAELGPNDAHQEARNGLRGVRSYVDAVRNQARDAALSNFSDEVAEAIAVAMKECPWLTTDLLTTTFAGVLDAQVWDAEDGEHRVNLSHP